MPNYWLAVASADHVRIGRAGGFMQVNHGKLAPLRRMKPDDGIVYYSPTNAYGGTDGLKSFTAIGIIKPGDPYLGLMSGGHEAHRRDVDWFAANETPIMPLLDELELTAGKKNWGYQLRFGVLPLVASDFALIARAMGANLDRQPVTDR